jgi:Ca2+-dependent lipid-binding protein
LELPKKLAGKANNSTIVIYSDELGTNKETFQMTLSGKGLDKKDLLGKSDPFAIISKKTDDGKWAKVFETEVIKKTLDPEWRPITGQTVSLTGKNPERRILFQVYDHDKNGKHDLIGEFETSFVELVASKISKS